MSKFSYSQKDLQKLLPQRNENSNKGSCGRVLVIGGSSCMAGAPYFSAKAAYRTGCGLVEIFTHEDNRVILQSLIPEAVMSTWGDKIDFDKLKNSIKKADVIAIGMGLSTSDKALKLGVGKLYGGNLNSNGNLSIAGHNEKDKFQDLEELEKGDTFIIVDKDLKETTYKITDITSVEPDDLECLRSDDSKTEITLITCQNGTTSRLIVKAEKTNSVDNV